MHTEPNARKRHKTRHPGVFYRVARDGRRAYEITYRDERRKQRWQRVEGDLETAKEALADVRRKLRRGEHVRPVSRTFTDVEREWSAIYLPRLRPSTAKTYRKSLDNYVLPAFGGLPVQRVDERAIARWITDMQAAGRKAWTIRAALTPLRRILTHAVRERLIAENPVTRLARDELPRSDAREPRVLTKDELAALFAAASERYRLPLQVLAFTGLRCSELLGLTWADIDLKAGTLQVTRQLDDAGERVRPKTPKAVRTVFLMDSLVRTLAAHKLASGYARPEDFVFPRDDGAQWSYAVLVAGFKAALRRAGLPAPAPTPHSLRHGFGSMLIAGGTDVVFVAGQMGHANPTITLRIYAHEFGQAEAARKMVAGMNREFGALAGG